MGYGLVLIMDYCRSSSTGGDGRSTVFGKGGCGGPPAVPPKPPPPSTTTGIRCDNGGCKSRSAQVTPSASAQSFTSASGEHSPASPLTQFTRNISQFNADVERIAGTTAPSAATHTVASYTATMENGDKRLEGGEC